MASLVKQAKDSQDFDESEMSELEEELRHFSERREEKHLLSSTSSSSSSRGNDDELWEEEEKMSEGKKAKKEKKMVKKQKMNGEGNLHDQLTLLTPEQERNAKLGGEKDVILITCSIYNITTCALLSNRHSMTD